MPCAWGYFLFSFLFSSPFPTHPRPFLHFPQGAGDRHILACPWPQEARRSGGFAFWSDQSLGKRRDLFSRPRTKGPRCILQHATPTEYGHPMHVTHASAAADTRSLASYRLLKESHQCPSSKRLPLSHPVLFPAPACHPPYLVPQRVIPSGPCSIAGRQSSVESSRRRRAGTRDAMDRRFRGWEYRAAVASSCRSIPAMQSCIYVPGPTIRCRGMNGQLGCDGQCNSHIGRTWAAIQLHRPSLSPKSTYQPIPTTSEYVGHQPTTRYVRRETVR
ncbi:hypothetical protein BGZ61DRAFT_128251 [Ilyonectria robusta]|uniref:uncharacterized protein n=1 Tax=Ilyonectria robusta TaxID=1079257 RepID=UPI001E8DBBD4|nr:uncharacterized protein BGZ61DRAFT_128251 [Ilyonectria robusta]KAH8734701.1 hypothetical protein BGZ61DRAFT_128251 [Ilyonectria robusta]